MTAPVTCPHEADVLDLVAIGQWPQRADAVLRAHVATCEACMDAALVAEALAEARDAEPRAIVPDASVMWRLAQQRARQDAAVRATRPLVFAQAAAAVVALAAAVIWGGAGASWLASWWNSVRQSASGLMPTAGSLSDMASTSTTAWWLIAAAAGWAVFATLALFAVRLADRTAGPESHS